LVDTVIKAPVQSTSAPAAQEYLPFNPTGDAGDSGVTYFKSVGGSDEDEDGDIEEGTNAADSSKVEARNGFRYPESRVSFERGSSNVPRQGERAT
jgi:hypothetical protein